MTLDWQRVVAATFSEQLGTPFRVHHEPSAISLELVEVSDGSAGPRVKFSLVFRGPQQPLLPQRIYPLDHDRLGRVELFLVPIRRDAHGLYYEAVVNRVETTAPPTPGGG